VPIILVGLLVFVLLALAGVVLLSLAVRYRAGTSRRQARLCVAILNVWITSFSLPAYECLPTRPAFPRAPSKSLSQTSVAAN